MLCPVCRIGRHISRKTERVHSVDDIPRATYLFTFALCHTTKRVENGFNKSAKNIGTECMPPLPFGT